MAESVGAIALDLELNQSGFNSQLSGNWKDGKEGWSNIGFSFCHKENF